MPPKMEEVQTYRAVSEARHARTFCIIPCMRSSKLGNVKIAAGYSWGSSDLGKEPLGTRSASRPGHWLHTCTYVVMASLSLWTGFFTTWVISQNRYSRGTWVAQSVKDPTLAQVVISWFVSSSPVSGSVLTVQILCLPLSAPPLLVLCLSVSLSLKYKYFLKTHKCCRGCGEIGALVCCWGECKQVWRVLKTIKIELPYDLAIRLLSV